MNKIRNIHELCTRIIAITIVCLLLANNISWALSPYTRFETSYTPNESISAEAIRIAKEKGVRFQKYEINNLPAFPAVVEWLITERCNRKCKGCWSGSTPKIPMSSLTLKDHKALVDIIYEQGVRSISVTGGEALLVPHIVELLKYCKTKKGLQVNLYTNGTLIKKAIECIPYVDFLSLSVDASTEKRNAALRGGVDGDLGRVFELIKRLRGMKKKPRLQIVSVIHSGNLDDIENIGKLIYYNGLNQIEDFRWKISYYIPRGRKSEFEQLEYDLFEKKAQEMKKKFSEIDVGYAPKINSGSCLIIGQGEDLITIIEGDYALVGNLKTMEFREDTEEIFSLIKSVKIKETRHLGRMDTYSLLKRDKEIEITIQRIREAFRKKAEIQYSNVLKEKSNGIGLSEKVLRKLARKHTRNFKFVKAIGEEDYSIGASLMAEERLGLMDVSTEDISGDKKKKHYHQESEWGQTFIDTVLLQAHEARRLYAEGKIESSDILMGLDSGLIPEIQRPFFRGMLNELKRLRKEKGLKNLIIEDGEGEDLANIISDIAADKAIPNSNIILLGRENILDSDSFDLFREIIAPEKRSFFVGVELPKDFPEDNYIRLLEMMSKAINLWAGEDKPADTQFLQIIQEGKKFYKFIIPEIEPMDYLLLKEIYKGQLEALRSA